MSFERKQFTFYRSFWEAMQKLPAKKREKLALFIIEYALNETEPDTKDSALCATFSVIRPILDSGRSKAQAGKIGGVASGEARSKAEAKPKQNEAKPKQNEAKQKQEKEQEQEKEQVQGEEQEQGQCFPGDSDSSLFSDAFDRLRSCGVVMAEQEDVVRLCTEYGQKAVIAAIERAKEQNVNRWPYIRAIVVSGGVQGGRRKAQHIIGHDDPPGPVALAAIKQMLEEEDDE